MKETLIEFKTAKLAKEKGFDWSTSELYTFPDGKLELPETPEECYQLKKNWNKYSDTTTAPIQSLLQKWLREEHNIDTQPYLIEMLHNGEQILIPKSDKEYAYRIYKDGIDEFISINIPPYNSYEEALEKALFEALNTI